MVISPAPRIPTDFTRDGRLRGDPLNFRGDGDGLTLQTLDSAAFSRVRCPLNPNFSSSSLTISRPHSDGGEGLLFPSDLRSSLTANRRVATADCPSSSVRLGHSVTEA
ncbi:hypothetical protein PIB30_073996 [Stylosanthes scabra]|uniref:Uncharacterized protein n=1 Tax=Stylosanthes scabra TaxID=79078 RepID=A0ABU6WSA9_9FABA|nr:hypothetical protein [Stylosanthes scabra]